MTWLKKREKTKMTLAKGTKGGIKLNAKVQVSGLANGEKRKRKKAHKSQIIQEMKKGRIRQKNKRKRGGRKTGTWGITTCGVGLLFWQRPKRGHNY